MLCLKCYKGLYLDRSEPGRVRTCSACGDQLTHPELRFPGLDCHEVAPNLWVGSRPKFPDAVYVVFDLIVLCATEYQPDPLTWPKTAVHLCPFEDTMAPEDAELDRVRDTVPKVVEALQNNKRVLVTCLAGQNRSALVAGLAMHRHYNVPPKSVLTAIRAVRHGAFSNYTFERLMLRPLG